MSKPNQIYYDLLQSNLENNDSEPILCQFSEQIKSNTYRKSTRL